LGMTVVGREFVQKKQPSPLFRKRKNLPFTAEAGALQRKRGGNFAPKKTRFPSPGKSSNRRERTVLLLKKKRRVNPEKMQPVVITEKTFARKKTTAPQKGGRGQAGPERGDV